MRTNLECSRKRRAPTAVLALVLAALGASGCGPSEPSVAQLVDRLESGSPGERLRSAIALEVHGAEAAVSLAPLLESQDWVVRAQAVAVLGHLGDAGLDLVGGATADDHVSVRVQAYAALHAAPGPDAAHWLGRGLQDPDSNARARAMRGLASMAEQATGELDLIAAVLEDPDRQTSRFAAQALSRMGAPAVPSLTTALTSDLATARVDAAWALGQIGAAAAPALPALRGAGTDNDPRVRSAADIAISSIEAVAQ